VTCTSYSHGICRLMAIAAGTEQVHASCRRHDEGFSCWQSASKSSWRAYRSFWPPSSRGHLELASFMLPLKGGRRLACSLGECEKLTCDMSKLLCCAIKNTVAPFFWLAALRAHGSGSRPRGTQACSSGRLARPGAPRRAASIRRLAQCAAESNGL